LLSLRQRSSPVATARLDRSYNGPTGDTETTATPDRLLVLEEVLIAAHPEQDRK
jgi:hypothetical protein